MPETVRVFFHRKEVNFGIERDVQDSSNWEMAAVVSKDRATGITGAIAGSVLTVWDDLPALFDGAGTNTNSAALQTRADEVGDNVRDRINVSEERFRRMYSGMISTVLPGSQVSEVRWRDFGDETGAVTEIIRTPPKGPGGAGLGNWLPANERLGPPDLSRASHPVYPRVSQPVQVDDGATATGGDVAPNGSGVIPGFVLRNVAGTYSQIMACWIKPTDLEGGGTPSEATTISLRQKDRFHGRLSGTLTHSADTRPLYLVRAGESTTTPGATLFDITADTGGPLTIAASDTIDFDASDLVWSTEANGTQSLRGIVQEVEVDGVDTTIKRLKTSVDKSVLQNIDLAGGNTSGTDPVLVRDGTRNSITFQSSPTTSDLEIIGGTGVIDFQTVFGPPIGSIIFSYKAPKLVSGKYFIDRDGNADTDWALMDGVSNASPPGSGITMWDRTSSGDMFFVRARNALTDADDTAFGRSINRSTDSDVAGFSVDDHEDHRHTFSPDECHADVVGTNDHFDFSTIGPINTSGALAIPGNTALTLEHTVQISSNDNGTASNLELRPPYKKLHYFERVRYTAAAPTTVPP
jgi:hypothetical protein